MASAGRNSIVRFAEDWRGLVQVEAQPKGPRGRNVGAGKWGAEAEDKVALNDKSGRADKV